MGVSSIKQKFKCDANMVLGMIETRAEKVMRIRITHHL